MDWEEIDEWESIVTLYKSHLRKCIEEWASLFEYAFYRPQDSGGKEGDVMVITDWFYTHFKAFCDRSDIAKDDVLYGILEECRCCGPDANSRPLADEFSIKLIEGKFAPLADYSPSTIVDLVSLIVYRDEYSLGWGSGDRHLILRKIDDETYHLRVELRDYDYNKREKTIEIPAIFELKK